MFLALLCQGMAEEMHVRFRAVALSHLAERFCECVFGLAKHAQVNFQVHGLPS